MFGSLASTSTSTSRHLSRDPFAFLDTGKQYVTMIREVLPARYTPSSKLSVPLTHSLSSSSSASSSSSSSSSSTYVGTPSSWDLHHHSDASVSSDEEEDDELETPPASPHHSSVSLPGVGKGKSTATLGFPFSFDEVSEDDDARGGGGRGGGRAVPALDWISPASPLVVTSSTKAVVSATRLASPSLDESSSPSSPLSSVPVVATLPPAAATRTTTTTKPTRREEERLRGRTRSPRLLWRSHLDRTALDLLDTYHDRTVGGALPRLTPGMDRAHVRNWSRRVENAGI
ncbi:hypothetical protein JCM11491_006672 [Sporobolomyces phaffii]